MLSTLSQTVHKHNLFRVSQLSEGLPGSIRPCERPTGNGAPATTPSPWLPPAGNAINPQQGKAQRLRGCGFKVGRQVLAIARDVVTRGRTLLRPRAWLRRCNHSLHPLGKIPLAAVRQKPIEVEALEFRHPSDENPWRFPWRARLVGSGSQHNGPIPSDHELVGPTAHAQRFEQPPEMALFGRVLPANDHKVTQTVGVPRPPWLHGKATAISWHFNHNSPKNPAKIRQLGRSRPPDAWGATLRPTMRREARVRRGRLD